MRLLELLLIAWMLCGSSLSYALVWGSYYRCYEDTAQVTNDSLEWSLVDVTLVTEERGVEENFWLTVLYIEKGEGKRFTVFASRIWEDGSPFRLFSLDGYPIGRGSFTGGEDDNILTYEYDIDGLYGKRIKFTRVSHLINKKEEISAVMVVDGKEIVWHANELRRYTPCPYQVEVKREELARVFRIALDNNIWIKTAKAEFARLLKTSKPNEVLTVDGKLLDELLVWGAANGMQDVVEAAAALGAEDLDEGMVWAAIENHPDTLRLLVELGARDFVRADEAFRTNAEDRYWGDASLKEMRLLLWRLRQGYLDPSRIGCAE